LSSVCNETQRFGIIDSSEAQEGKKTELKKELALPLLANLASGTLLSANNNSCVHFNITTFRNRLASLGRWANVVANFASEARSSVIPENNGTGYILA
jgi:hypothetical protein